MKPTLISMFALTMMAWSGISAQPTIIPTSEKNAIIYNLEEKKLSHDLYVAFESKWDAQIFENIARTEQDHFNYLLKLTQELGIEVPATILSNEKGIYYNPNLQEEYNTMLASGSKSLIDALTIGAKMEEMDIVDLHKVMDVTNETKVFLAYDRLYNTTRNHLRAFVRNLNAQGIDYSPVMLARDEYDKIIGETIKFKVNPINDL